MTGARDHITKTLVLYGPAGAVSIRHEGSHRPAGLFLPDGDAAGAETVRPVFCCLANIAKELRFRYNADILRGDR